MPGGGGSGGSAAFLGYKAYASNAGQQNDVDPGLTQQNFRLLVTLAGGDAQWSGLAAGVDGQAGLIFNGDAANTLTVQSQNGSSLAANRFWGPADIILPPGASLLVIYTTQGVARWLAR
jgi:hypothetical protein